MASLSSSSSTSICNSADLASDAYLGQSVSSPTLENISNSSPSSSEESSSNSDSTLSDPEARSRFGHPLERIQRSGSVYRDFSSDSEVEPYFWEAFTAEKNSVYSSSATTSRTRSNESLPSISVASSVDYDDVDYEILIDVLLSQSPSPFSSADINGLTMFTPPTSPVPPFLTSRSCAYPTPPPLMIKPLPRSSSELRLLLELNQPEARSDPWNPTPHILCAVERMHVGTYEAEQEEERDEEKGTVYLCLERLRPYNRPPMERVVEYIDFFRQVLEGLSFLHEHYIANLHLSRPTSYMVDLSSAPRPSQPTSSAQSSLSSFGNFSFDLQVKENKEGTNLEMQSAPTLLSASASYNSTTPTPTHPTTSNPNLNIPDQTPTQTSFTRKPPSRTPTLSTTFDRTSYPVRYYFVDFSEAQRVDISAKASSEPLYKHAHGSSGDHEEDTASQIMRRDVHECGEMLDAMLNSVSICFSAILPSSSFLFSYFPYEPNYHVRLGPTNPTQTQVLNHGNDSW
ncbi:hypothetical protein BDQ12DRAFT_682819 [Crucibulum laeve]|uniref:Protein kinase domain-containing protein n=1 Tax=Crucibulum laeve TaxID=68775 RepID=A0A5C3MCU7_9AGAR|nr:hypothetical protein BDQ12DRAFT_682819 [Crucibulum laeve]